ncbi:hypothetical protein DVH24_026368 [Malus domestica]|uniref:Potassium channel domain-containing protein n=1 Tax=Malus domestica TaxID=3750 RepID=A0A498KNF8_MALDO|nr:hypothetical protein DVH24_026368 [Malus domestica]
MLGNSSKPIGTSAPAIRNLYYSFDVGLVNFVYILTETNFVEGSKQLEVLKQDLEAVDRRKMPFVVVQRHRPINKIGDVPEGENADTIEKLSLMDAFYCVCSTISTLGYGDKSFSTQAGGVFAMFWILKGTIC